MWLGYEVPQAPLTEDEKGAIRRLIDAWQRPDPEEWDEMDLFWHNYGVDQAMQDISGRTYEEVRRAAYVLAVAYRARSMRYGPWGSA